jgi:MFS family permease
MFNEIIKSLRLNKVIRYFVLCDLFLFSGWGLLSPIMSVFVVQHIVGASLFNAGAAASLYWAARSVVQLPTANMLDKRKGEKDDFYVLIVGLLLASLAAFSFSLVKNIPELYIVMVIQGIAFGLYQPAWSGIFSRHLDEDRFAFDWSMDGVGLGIASMISGLTGGYLADTFGFNTVFYLAAFFSFVSAVIVFSVPKIIFPGKTKSNPTIIMDHTPKNISS